ncbi:MAG: acyl-CoA thioesterase [Crocinitomicaceae bacterium]
MEFSFSYTHTLRVRYSETDRMGYCYYGNYAQYLEVGRVEAIRTLGFAYKELENAGVLLPVSNLNIRYKNPAFYDDELIIHTAIDKIVGARIFFSYIIECHEKLIAEADTTLVFVDKKINKPIACPDFFLEKLRSYEK